jgi:hypothetical protein
MRGLRASLAADDYWTAGRARMGGENAIRWAPWSLRKRLASAIPPPVGTTIYSGDRLAATLRQRTDSCRRGPCCSERQHGNGGRLRGAPSAKQSAAPQHFNRQCQGILPLRFEAVIRAQSDAPTIGQVTYLNEKELLVVSKRGPLTVTVDGETEVIADGSAYRVLLDPPPAMAQGPEGAGAHKDDKKRGMNGPPLKAGRNYFMVTAVGVSAIVTAFAVSEALESPNRP